MIRRPISLLQSVMLLLLSGVVLYAAAGLYRVAVPKTSTAEAIACTAASFSAEYSLPYMDESEVGLCVVVPAAALRADEDGCDIVYIRRGGRAVMRSVTVLAYGGSNALVTARGSETPIADGDLVITRPDRLYAGMPTE